MRVDFYYIKDETTGLVYSHCINGTPKFKGMKHNTFFYATQDLKEVTAVLEHLCILIPNHNLVLMEKLI